MPQSWGHGTDYLTSPPKEGMLRIFIYRKIQRLRPGLNPRNREPEASMRNTKPPKPPAFHYVTNEYFSQDTRNKQCQEFLFNSTVVPIKVMRHQ
jgi:hypothetical protein